jgi:HSP20 family protein
MKYNLDRKSLLSLSWDKDETSLSNRFYDESDISLSEDDKHVYVETALPGLSPEEIEIKYEKGILTVRGDRKEETKSKDHKFYRKTNKHFFYQIPIPGRVNENKVPQASCKDGLLKVSFSKLEENPKKKISIKKG